MDIRDQQIASLRDEVYRLQRLLGLHWLPHEKLNLRPQERTILGFLVKRGEASMETLHEMLWGGRSDGGPEYGVTTIKVCICRIRKQLRPFGMSIKTVCKTGYFMSSADRAKLAKEGVDETPAKVAIVMAEREYKNRSRAQTKRRIPIPRSDRRKGPWSMT